MIGLYSGLEIQHVGLGTCCVGICRSIDVEEPLSIAVECLVRREI
jgi:hypothetical protein